MSNDEVFDRLAARAFHLLTEALNALHELREHCEKTPNLERVGFETMERIGRVFDQGREVARDLEPLVDEEALKAEEEPTTSEGDYDEKQRQFVQQLLEVVCRDREAFPTEVLFEGAAGRGANSKEIRQLLETGDIIATRDELSGEYGLIVGYDVLAEARNLRGDFSVLLVELVHGSRDETSLVSLIQAARGWPPDKVCE